MFLYNLSFFFSLLFVICAGVWGFATHQRRQVFRERALFHCQALSEYFDSLFTSFDRLSVTVGHNARLRSLASDPVSELDFDLIDSTMRVFRPAGYDYLPGYEQQHFQSGHLFIWKGLCDFQLRHFHTGKFFTRASSLWSQNALSEYLRPLDAGSFLFLPRSEDSNSYCPRTLFMLSHWLIPWNTICNLFIFLDDREIGQHLERLVDSAKTITFSQIKIKLF